MSIWLLIGIPVVGIIGIGWCVYSVMNDLDENGDPKELME